MLLTQIVLMHEQVPMLLFATQLRSLYARIDAVAILLLRVPEFVLRVEVAAGLAPVTRVALRAVLLGRRRQVRAVELLRVEYLRLRHEFIASTAFTAKRVEVLVVSSLHRSIRGVVRVL